MKMWEFAARERELYAVCHGAHGFLVGARRVGLDLSKLELEMKHEDLRGKVRCTACGTNEPRTIFLIPQAIARRHRCDSGNELRKFVTAF
jgi:hypothetical protein